MSEKNTVSLDRPITVDGSEISSLSFRRAKVRDLQAVEGVSGDVSKTVALAANLAEVPRDAFEEMDAADFSKVAGVIEGFLG